MAAARKAEGKGARRWPTRFFLDFLDEMDAAGYSPEEMARYVWKPFAPEDLRIVGARRDRSFRRLEATPREIERQLAGLPARRVSVDALQREQKLVLLLLPGFTHHTLQYPAFQEQVEGEGAVLSVLKLGPPKRGRAPEETLQSRGRSGMKLVYVAYPRSNAASEVILEPTFEMLARSRTLKRWVDAGYKLLFVGYSYGAALAFELIEALNTGRFEDPFLLPATEGVLTINGAVGGSYLADAIADPEALVNVQKAVGLTRSFSALGSVLGIRTEQDREDVVGGIRSLGHAVRQERLARMLGHMPKQLKYLSICAFLPESDYETNPLSNLDDSTLYLQSLASKGVSIYNDGQMVLNDCFVPPFRGVPKRNRIDLGAVRTHHWGVSWRTFKSGVNPFPRRQYCRALLRTLREVGIGEGAPS